MVEIYIKKQKFKEITKKLTNFIERCFIQQNKNVDYKIIKEILYQECQKFVENAIQISTDAMKEAQNAANSETKSSAGDKYETTRAMMQIEKEAKAKQLSNALKIKEVLDKINIKTPSKIVQVGSLVHTNYGFFFIAISAGKTIVENQTFFAISTASPMCLQLLQKTTKDIFNFQNKTFEILEIY